MLDTAEFDSAVVEKVSTLKESISVELSKTPEARELKVPFYVPIRQDKLFNDFKKAVTEQLRKDGYDMSDFLAEYQILGYGVLRYVLITII